ncbi:MAG: hypothetical protein O3A87_02345 [Verrucomicrobia bacterium]|nr:hypothetical protein [Verrucomicrobiota bacterium]MDA1005309.1 hypothetical protein [Verrucomicrobiota bacterium]
MHMHSSKFLSWLFVGSLGLSSIASAVSLSFVRQTSNSAVDVAADLSLEVISGGPNTVQFIFSKGALYDGFITQIYFEDGDSLFSVIDFDTVLSSPGVAYASPATPANPPGVNPFATSFSLDPNNPQPTWGISAGENGTFIGTFAGPLSFADVENAITNGTLRFALHAQGLPGGESDSFLAIAGGGPDDPPLPEPSTSLFGGLALLFLCLRRKR